MIIVFGVGISTVATSGLTLYLTGTLNLVALVITLGLCYLLYTGRNWVRWPAGVLWILSGSILIFASLTLSFGASLMGLIYYFDFDGGRAEPIRIADDPRLAAYYASGS